MKLVNTSILLLIVSLNSHAHKVEEEYNNYKEKEDYCRTLQQRNITDFEDDYYHTLTDIQKYALITNLAIIAKQKCVSYEKLNYFEYVIRTGNKEGLEIIDRLSAKIGFSLEFRNAYKALDKKEIERLSNTGTFSTPFRVFSLTKDLNIKKGTH